ncbi:helix-turn-helix transcriptional regulator [Streptomyces bambusae]|uniref:helix-turn-helix domain-containing protein n=1 Tax=Streptomyces bambusae TaxID=1550616 RepID=UPI001CFE6700|nr:helix-turn-helix transcriptional regulator [Streptomyces bambusae]MCB5168475.1 helix-turn-helix transcriptional regulator [Streptomyces bambusae]
MTNVDHDGESEVQPNSSLLDFGEMAKAFRKRAGLTQEQAADRLRYSVQYIGSIEQGRRYPSDRFVERAEDALDAFGILRMAAKQLTRQRGIASWFQPWAELEDIAVALNTYECRVVPGLLQPESYARALIRNVPPPPTADQVEARVKMRLERQKLLHRVPLTNFSFILDQVVIERQTGGSEVTNQLIEHLLEISTLTNVELQIMPTIQPEHAGTGGPICLLETEDNKWVGYSEGQRMGQMISRAKDVSALHQRYAKLRSQALNPAQSRGLLERMRGTL